jgi:hypothetical protein
VRYTEREGCPYVELRWDNNRGWRDYFYDDQGMLVASKYDNAFGGSGHCGVETACAGTILLVCRPCRGEKSDGDGVPDCPKTLWATAGEEGP